MRRICEAFINDMQKNCGLHKKCRIFEVCPPQKSKNSRLSAQCGRRETKIVYAGVLVFSMASTYFQAVILQRVGQRTKLLVCHGALLSFQQR